jgi:ABC-type multidrug transport system fused ATPase/permease subunit
MVDMENTFELLAEEEEIKDVPGALTFTPRKTDIQFKNVSFHYNQDQPILKNMSFTVPEGTMTAIVGPSGSGKSTIVNLLLRFYDPIEGEIRIDNQDIRLLDQTSLRRNIGMVPQDTVLFNDSIAYNIDYGKIGSSPEEIVEAVTLANLNEKIDTFPDGYITLVGERGLKLSGGEKQRVALARTFIRSPKLLLLDEATSALDTATERNIQESLLRVCKDRTCIIVAHRLSTVRDADQILVLGGGEVVERGTHQELIDRREVYADMWRQQQIN